MKKAPTEAQEMGALAAYLDARRLTWCHVANEQRRRRHGVKRGVPGVLIFSYVLARPEVRGVAIELKRVRGGGLSCDQLAWLNDLAALGWLTRMCRGAGEAIKFIKEVLPKRHL